ncbi:IclR family transcriptional regulator [Sphingobium fuliginis]|nr:IclR family transcriptional regulator [Sphingobium fuliginis]
MATRTEKRESEADTQAFIPPRSPLRVMKLLEELAGEPRGLPAVRLLERMDLPKTSLVSLLRALEEARYVVKHKGLYQLGEAALRLSSLISVSFPFPHSVHDLLMDLMTRCNETAMLATLSEDGQAAVYVDKVECQRAIRFAGFIGARRPLYCTAIGKALLAFQDEAFIKHYLKYNKFEPFGPDTITDRGKLEREIEKIRKEGVSVAIEEMAEGIGVYASPVFDGLGTVRAAVSVAAPAQRARAMSEEYSQEVKSIARQMSLLLGWKPNGDTPDE